MSQFSAIPLGEYVSDAFEKAKKVFNPYTYFGGEESASPSPCVDKLESACEEAIAPSDCIDEMSSAAQPQAQEVVEPLGGTPELSPPNEQIIETARCLKETDTFVTHFGKEAPLNDFFDTEDVDILRQLFACFTIQRELKQEKELLTHQDIAQQNERQQELRKIYFDLKDQIKQRKESAKIFGYINIGAAVALAGLTMFSFMITGGATGALGFGMACAGVSQGTTGITKGVLDYQNNVQSGDLFMVEHEREEIHQEINDGIRELSEAIQGVMRTWGDLRQVLTNRMDALRGIK